MVNWQLTATTIYCDAVQDEVTIFVYKDGSLGCTGFNPNESVQNQTPDTAAVRGALAESKKGCLGLPCENTVSYRDRLMAEEKDSDE